MPYIEDGRRGGLRAGAVPENTGELNYLISWHVHSFIAMKAAQDKTAGGSGLRYETINAAIGVLECAKLELYRQLAVPYEDWKKMVNGSVSGLDFGDKKPGTYENWLAKLFQRDPRTMHHEVFQQRTDEQGEGPVTPEGERAAMDAASDVRVIAAATPQDGDEDVVDKEGQLVTFADAANHDSVVTVKDGDFARYVMPDNGQFRAGKGFSLIVNGELRNDTAWVWKGDTIEVRRT